MAYTATATATAECYSSGCRASGSSANCCYHTTVRIYFPSSKYFLCRCIYLLSALSVLLPRSARADDDGWSYGRATFYGYDGGATIDQGSCMYGPLPNWMVSTGKNIAALSDRDAGFAGSCGRCYEVACEPMSFSDGDGEYRQYKDGGCINPGSTVTVTITDSCPCYYPSNADSNRRWCCGDMFHMDMSEDAFSQVGNTAYGFMGIKYRQVNCPGGFVPSPRRATDDFPAGTGSR